MQVPENVYLCKNIEEHHIILSIMSVESIIGIASGLIAIGSFVAMLWNRFKKKSVSELLHKLVDTNLSPKEQKDILRKINRRLEGHPISEAYIEGFALKNMKREAVFKDICLKNNIYPKTDICKSFLNADMKKFRDEYDTLKASIGAEEPSTEAATPTPANKKEQTVYMSELLMEKYPDTCKRLISILEKHNIKYAFIKGTNDIWCRDYMPVRTESGKLIQFKYEPSYLKGKPEWEALRSDVHVICELNGLKVQESDINLDGGNVLICDGRAIISNRVFTENPDRSKDYIMNELSRLLECEIIFIPDQKSDMTGHADGMVRFVDRNTILGNNLAAEYDNWSNPMLKVLKEYNLSYIDVPFYEPKYDRKHPLNAEGIYVNYLEVNNLIVLPEFGRNEDKEAFAVIQKAFPDKVIETIDYNDVALEGGLLNCTTWVV